MKLVSEVYENLGKTLLTIGQAVIIGTLAAWLFSKEAISFTAGTLGLVLSFILFFVGLGFIQKSHYVKKLEEKEK